MRLFTAVTLMRQVYPSVQTKLDKWRDDISEMVFVLGDLFDEGDLVGRADYEDYVERFRRMFRVPEGTKVQAVVGNHDVGFHYSLQPERLAIFESAFQTPLVHLVSAKGSDFVILNSMSFEGDGCDLCSRAAVELQEISSKLRPKSCSDGAATCQRRPFVLLHFPLFRKSEAICNEPDGAPPELAEKPFRPKWECLSLDATERILNLLNPRGVFSGHSHNGCFLKHNQTPEWTVSSFNWRNRNNPAFLLTQISPSDIAVSKCLMPQESTVIMLYKLSALCILCLLLTPLWKYASRLSQAVASHPDYKRTNNSKIK
ncbi:unnamed protein product [Cyprideis torosa]|uniref:Calcineurin-like phosphoesterase domain-containing protein n=1 Tax=Cyprideis torosa TaxID=163714 RepID=A0A7R8WG77_9CRUS|nr:unnamed protein product [Cyprideis torosa]CAG0891776.1 unnamed protein product [Cyprideis torosa]